MKPSVPAALTLTQRALGVGDATMALLFGASAKQWREWRLRGLRLRRGDSGVLPQLQRAILAAVTVELDRLQAPGLQRNFGLWLEHQLETRPILEVLAELHQKRNP